VFENPKIPEMLLTQLDIWTNVFTPSEKTLFDFLEKCMSNVESKMSQSVSFDVFLNKLEKEIAKNTN
jgi:hypothetical protein